MNIPSEVVQYYAYDENDLMVGVADVTLPKLEYLSNTVKGAGISGEIDLPVIGSTKSLKVSINWRSLVNETAKFIAPKGHTLIFRASVQEFSAETGTYRIIPVKVTLRVLPQNIDMGKLENGNPIGSSSEFEILYIKLEIDNKVMYEIDKANSIFIVNGVDYLADVRVNAGLNG